MCAFKIIFSTSLYSHLLPIWFFFLFFLLFGWEVSCPAERDLVYLKGNGKPAWLWSQLSGKHHRGKNHTSLHVHLKPNLFLGFPVVRRAIFEGFYVFAIKWLLSNTVDIICASMFTSELCDSKLWFSFLTYVTNDNAYKQAPGHQLYRYKHVQTCLFFYAF